MDWKIVVAQFVAMLVARIAPLLVEMIAGWIQQATDEDKVAMADAIGDALRKV